MDLLSIQQSYGSPCWLLPVSARSWLEPSRCCPINSDYTASGFMLQSALSRDVPFFLVFVVEILAFLLTGFTLEQK